MTTRQRRPGQALPLLLIALGCLVLIANLGWLRVDVWRLAQLWPLLLVAAGVDFLLGGRYRLAVVLMAALVAAGIYAGVGIPPGVATARTETVAQALGGAQRAEVRFEVGVSELRLDADPDADMLVEGTVQTARGERIRQDFRERGGIAFFTLRSERRSTFGVNTGRRVWDLSLNPSVPLELAVETGVGRATIDLTGTQLTHLSVATGVGETQLTLPRSGRYAATLDTGVGAATVRIPEGVAVRLEVSRGVGAVSVQGEFEYDGDRYLSSGYDTAENRVDLRVNGGVGAITVERFD